jgi:primosomal protein N' (replication factor Y)
MLIDKMQERLDKGEQSILFINRRGYNKTMLCPDCGYVAMCEQLQHHPDPPPRRGRAALPPLRLRGQGPEHLPQVPLPRHQVARRGTQRIEDIARQFIPKARIVRIDADTMQKKDLFRVILGDFRKGKIDVLVGTQMIAKGLDFPNVTLVGLVEADLSLHVPDFRAAERTFQLLVQVAGRAGRGDRAGEVVVQTYLPYSPPVQFARAQDFDGFAEEELANRREFNYPPFRHLVHHIFRGKNPEKLAFYAEQWARKAEELLGPQVEIRGPHPRQSRRSRTTTATRSGTSCPPSAASCPGCSNCANPSPWTRMYRRSSTPMR